MVQVEVDWKMSLIIRICDVTGGFDTVDREIALVLIRMRFWLSLRTSPTVRLVPAR